MFYRIANRIATFSKKIEALFLVVCLLLVWVCGAWFYSNTLPRAEAAGWYNASWTHRAVINIDPDKIGSTLTDFPVYVDLSDMRENFWANVKSGCVDIRVTSSDGTTEVPREVVTCSTSGKTGELWFKAPSISSSVNTAFYIYYGNSGASDYATSDTYGAENVWTNGYVAVYHLKDGTTLSLLDSTSNSYDGTNTGATAVSGELDGGLEVNGSSQYFSTGAPNGSTRTLSAWIYPDTSDDVTNIESVIDSDVASQYGTGWGLDNGYFKTILDNQFWTTTKTVTLGTWQYVAFSFNASSAQLYVNGSLSDSLSYTQGSVTSANYLIGKSNANTSYFDGKVDEARISSSVRSADWIAAEYANQSSPSTFYSVFNTEGPSGQTTFTTPVYITGDASVTGALAKGSGTFVIDHPLDPANKLLFHSFVESPDVKNIYDGIVTLDDNGEATVKLPDYFEALNGDDSYRYLLTPIGQPAPDLYVTKEGIVENKFTIAGGPANARVSWQVTGIRHDPYILANPIIPEVDKGPDQLVDKGKYLYEGYGE